LQHLQRAVKTNKGIDELAQSLGQARGQIVVEGYANKDDVDKMAASLGRANRAREAMIRNGIAPERVLALGRGEQPGKNGGVRVVEVPITPKIEGQKSAGDSKADNGGTSEPIGTSHFESDSPMTVPRGTSAMVSIMSTEAEGEVVYLYDPESPRGNTQFPFRSVRLKNPTDSALESGPVTQMAEYRTRMDELHAQIVTLRAVKMTSGSLLTNLEKKLGDISDRLSKATVTVVGLQEQLMVARIRFQDGVAELSLETKQAEK
jgi:hypothetical protein